MNKQAMKFKDWLHQVIALLIAWSILLSIAGLLDDLYNTCIHIFLIVWLCMGIAIMLLKKIDFPFPRVDRIDVPGAFKMLWHATFWPRFLMQK